MTEEKKENTTLKELRKIWQKETTLKLSIGKVNVKNLSLGERIAWTKKLAKPIKDSTPGEYFHCILPFVVYKIEEDIKKKLDENELAKITDLDKKLIINALIEINPGLTHKKATEATDKDGQRIVNIALGELQILQNEDETLVEYYHRLNVIHEENEHKSFKKLSVSLADKLKFSSSLNKELSSMMSGMGNIQKTLDKINSSNVGFLGLGGTSKLPGVVQEIPKEFFHVDLNSLKDHKLETLRKLDDQISTMPAKMDEAITVMTLMLSELKGSSDDAGESLKLTVQSLKVTVKSLKWTIGLSMIGLIVSSFSLYLSLNTSDAGKVLVPHMEMIKESLDTKNALEEKKLHLMEQSVSQNQILIQLIQADRKITSRIRK